MDMIHNTKLNKSITISSCYRDITMDKSAVYRAVERGDVDEVARLLADGYDYNRPDRHRVTPLHIACRDGRVEIARLLVDYGADPTVKTTNKKTPLMMACTNVHPDIVEILFCSGKLTDEDVYARDKCSIYATTMLFGCHPDRRRFVDDILHSFKSRGFSMCPPSPIRE